MRGLDRVKKPQIDATTNQLPKEPTHYEVFLLRHNRVTSPEHPSHTHTHLRKRSRVSGCASKIASDTKTSLVPKGGVEGEVEPSKQGC